MPGVTPEVIISPNSTILSKTLIDNVLAASASSGSTFMIAISGGSLPKIFAQAFIPLAPALDLSNWKIFFADERFVPIDHPDSNYFSCKENIFDKLGEKMLKTEQVFPIKYSFPFYDKSKKEVAGNKVGDPLDACAEHYTELLMSEFHKARKVRTITREDGSEIVVPVFDLILLGMGEDGHTCSLFPNPEFKHVLDEREKIILPIRNSPKPPPERITLTYPVLNHAKNVFYVVTGAGKKDVVPNVVKARSNDEFEDELREERILPAGRIRLTNQDARLVWFLDSAAAEKL